MKTLDEVIKAFEWCCNDDNDDCDECPYDGEDDGCHQRNLDALHYLREYRKLDSLDAVAFQEDDNPPLSWDELHTMEGKPVWVEQTFTHKKYTGWVINKGTDELALITDARSFDRATYGKTWQAYRKEHGTDS